MGKAKRRRDNPKGTRALPRNADGSYRLNLPQSIFILLHGHEVPGESTASRAVRKFIEAGAEAVHLGRKQVSDRDKIEFFMAWLDGDVRGADATSTMLLQSLAEGLDDQAHDLMAFFHAFARKQREKEMR